MTRRSILLTAGLLERFWPKVDTSAGPDACWPWTASLDMSGYGQISYGARGAGVIKAHRVALLVDGRDVGPGEHTDHLCRNRQCVNPRHLEVVTHGENLRRGSGAKLTHEQAAAIRRDVRPSRRVAEDYGVNHSAVVNIRAGKAWAA